MILNEIVLHNFGVYRGRHQVDLTPPSARKPVILFGGLNGGGKTTLLDALQLSLYGKRAQCSTRGDLAYPDFLRNSTNRKVSPAEGAGVSLTFTHTTEGRAHRYEVRRTWTSTEGGTREHVEVLRDEAIDEVLTETWDDQVDAFLPQELSHLFFFDGEKIKELATPDRSAEILRSGVYSLLGIDLVDRLTADLTTVERKARISLGTAEERANLDRAQTELAAAEQQQRELVQKRGSLQNDLDRKAEAYRVLEQKLRGEGGEIFENRAQIEKQLSDVRAELAKLEAEMLETAAGPMPLALLAPMLREMLEQGEREADTQRAQSLSTLLAERDAKLVDAVRGLAKDPAVAREIRQWLDRDRASREQRDTAASYLQMAPEALSELRSLQPATIGASVIEASRSVARAETLQARIVQFERKLAMAPDHDTIAALLEARIKAHADVEVARQRLAECDEALRLTGVAVAEAKARLSKLLSQRVSDEFAEEDTHRVIRASGRVRDSLNRFKTAVIERHVDRISGLILESYQQLMRKATLVQRVRIDPHTFDLDLRDRDDHPVPASRLSAGERQLLAVAILWGLARASGRGLPAVIDTPLGRLDSVHRKHLVERYFPKASHQVLLLSTDEEINESQLDRLRPHVGRSYRLDYDERRDASVITQGYFW